MLVLSRDIGEQIVIDAGQAGLIRVVVTAVGVGRVKLGIIAGDGIPVHRLEVWEKVKRTREVSHAT